MVAPSPRRCLDGGCARRGRLDQRRQGQPQGASQDATGQSLKTHHSFGFSFVGGAPGGPPGGGGVGAGPAPDAGAVPAAPTAPGSLSRSLLASVATWATFKVMSCFWPPRSTLTVTVFDD